ncbi:MAG: hypothetical protein FWF01_02600, partial [Alphaproteobacteria bacterium]|nr:hypothetical protein [Alphaproteobacteria bacterium]
MRTILLNLQNTQRLFDITQNRLSTNRKVNSALDSPAAYFTAQSLNTRATALDGLLDGMGQAVQTLRAADAGLTALTNFVSQAQALVNQSLDSNNVASSMVSGQTVTVNQALSGIGGVLPTDSFAIRTGNAAELRGTNSISLSQTLETLGFPNNAADNYFTIRLSGDEGTFQDVKISVSTSGAPGS